MTHVYRTPTLTPPVDTTPPWWQRVWYRINRGDAENWWQWARKAQGGRWARCYYYAGNDTWGWMWRRVETCPAEWPCLPAADIATSPLVLQWVLREASRTAAEHRRRGCDCEVWP